MCQYAPGYGRCRCEWAADRRGRTAPPPKPFKAMAVSAALARSPDERSTSISRGTACPPRSRPRLCSRSVSPLMAETTTTTSMTLGALKRHPGGDGFDALEATYAGAPVFVNEKRHVSSIAPLRRPARKPAPPPELAADHPRQPEPALAGHRPWRRPAPPHAAREDLRAGASPNRR